MNEEMAKKTIKKRIKNEHKNNIFIQIYTGILAVLLILSLLQIWQNGEKFQPIKTVKNIFTNQEKVVKIESGKIDLNSMENLKKVEDLINENYIGKKADNLSMEDEIIKGYVNSLKDEYSSFLTSEESRKLLDYIDEKYVGIGVAFENKEDALEIVQVFENSPAQKSGLKEGDMIVSVNEKLIVEYKPSTLAIKDIKGEENTMVSLGVLKKETGKLEKISVQRKTVNAPLINLSFTKNEEIAKINITSFGSNMDQIFKEKLKKANENTNTKLLVLDLRSNGGGYLDASIDILSYFVDENKVLVYEKTKNTTKEHKAIKKDFQNKLPVIVLTNEYSASASEITAIALKELVGAKIVGQTTFGKGVVQAMFSGRYFKQGQALKITVAEWLGPNQTKINKVGIKPDVEIKKEEDAFEFVKNHYNLEQKQFK